MTYRNHYKCDTEADEMSPSQSAQIMLTQSHPMHYTNLTFPLNWSKGTVFPTASSADKEYKPPSQKTRSRQVDRN